MTCGIILSPGSLPVPPIRAAATHQGSGAEGLGGRTSGAWRQAPCLHFSKTPLFWINLALHDVTTYYVPE